MDKEMVQETNTDRIANKLLDPFYTLKEVINRVENLEKRQERQERTQGAILKHIGMDNTKLNKGDCNG